MSGSTLLLINNIGYALDALLTIFLIGLLFVKDGKNTTTRLLMLALTAVLVYLVAQLIGVNVPDPHLSKLVLMWNTCNLFLYAFLAHFIFRFLGREKQQKAGLIIIYTLSIAIFIVYMIWPDTFLLDSAPKLYFPNYYVAGSLDWVMRLFSNVLIPIYFAIVMIFAYRKADPIMKNRIKYLFTAIVLGDIFGSTAIPLVFTSNPVFFGIYFDPVYSVLCIPFLFIPFVYAILKYNLLDITIVAKRAFVYSFSVVVVGLLIALLNFSNEIILTSYPHFPSWVLPVVSAVVAVSIGFFIWNKLRESEALKSEFITVVTHKFRTPLTQIRWATESLSANLSEEDKNSVVEVERASSRLVDLTNLLVQLSDTDTVEYNYQMRPMRLDSLVEDMKDEYIRRAGMKKISITFSGSSQKSVLADEAQTRFVIQTLLDNAISYTPQGGTINAEIKEEGTGRKSGRKLGNVVFSVTDSGIGLSKEDSSRVFEKFWRSPDARKADTEGMGIGLFMARRIMEREGGSLRTQSEGLGKGSTFAMRLPVSAKTWSSPSQS